MRRSLPYPGHLNQQWVLIAAITKLPSSSFFVTMLERPVIEHLSAERTFGITFGVGWV